MNKQVIKKIMEDAEALLTLKEGELLYSLPGKIPSVGVIVEIGSYKGGSTILLAKSAKINKKGKVYAVDPFSILPRKKKRIFNIFKKNIKNAKIDDWITPIVKTSKQAAKNWQKPISLLWIDGRHDYEYVKMDFLLWEKHLINGGIIAFHDSQKPIYHYTKGPTKVVKENIYNSKRFVEIKKVDTITYAIKYKGANLTERLENKLNLFEIEILPIYLAIDRAIGLCGVFLKRHNPTLYFLIKRIKK
ncbi:MAG: class I SAM-dependent methyltransferase [Candidatus Daviesbacteria bacterium]|nr:class I SAM-dependent methyltransferase [Candidatus Daviesbacteria bacterium]